MRCERCGIDYFGGSICTCCGGALKPGAIRFSRTGEPLSHMSPAGAGEAVLPMHHGFVEREAGRAEGALVRLSYKILESIFACALFSVLLRAVIFLVKVIDSLMETGGDIREGISFAADLQRAINWYEIVVWMLLVLVIFRFRHNPR